MKKNVNYVGFITIALLYLEIILRFIISNTLIDKSLIYLVIFIVPVILFISIISSLFNNRVNKIVLLISMILLTLYFEVQYIFYNLFSVPFSFSTISLADQALDFTSIIKDVIVAHLPGFLSLLVPLIVLIVLYKRITIEKSNKYVLISLIFMFIISYLSTYIFLIPQENQELSAKKLYYNVDDAPSMIKYFGIINYTKIDIKRQLFGYNNEIVTEVLKESQEEKQEEKKVADKKIEYNVLNLNFEDSNNKNINTLNNYFKNSNPTNKNQYTGMFKDKNIIFILAEAFNEVAVNEELTPTLYKLVNNSFVFNNFYSPVFLSTTGGEFQATTSLIPTQETLKLWKSKQPIISYGLGNVFNNLGYNTQSYHNWTYTYYKRDKTMKTLGFNNYLGCGNGLEKRITCKWLPSDIEMIDATVDDYLNKNERFATYYVTVSGHSPYNASDNIAKKYLDSYKDTNYSEAVKYYMASQIELDKMLETLINKLTISNELSNTVIALVGDHYPYTLSTDEMNQVSSYQKDGTIEVNHSNFILYNSEISEPIIIDKVGSQIDVLPTILNLFGVDYDSRLLLGRDILSDSEGLAIFSNRSWVSDYGTYFSDTKKFVKKDGVLLEDESEYIRQMNSKVSNYFSISKMLMDNNYYDHILNK